MNTIKPHNLAQPIHQEFAQNYQDKIITGINEAKRKNIIFTGICRNVEKNIQTILNFFNQTENLFNTVDYFFYENDSTDSTKDILKEWSNNQNNKIILSETINSNFHTEGIHQDRMKNLSDARNKYLNFVKIAQKPYDYVIVADMDLRYISIDGFFNSVGWLEDPNIDGIAGFSFVCKKFLDTENIENIYILNYDYWAFRQNYWSFDVHIEKWFNNYIPMIGSDPYMVNSAFGGMCIYKYSDFIKGKYDYHDCEHVMFHKNIHLKNPNFNLFVNPSQVSYV
jgi:hypothetical protein